MNEGQIQRAVDTLWSYIEADRNDPETWVDAGRWCVREVQIVGIIRQFAAHGAHVVAHEGVVAFIVFIVVRTFAKGSGFAIARCAQGVGFGQFVVGIGMGMTRWRGEGTVRGFVPQANCPGTVVVFIEKLFDVIGEEVGVVSPMFDFLSSDDKDRVFVVSLTAKVDPALKAGFGIAAGQGNAFGSVVYFSKEARAISGFL